MSAQTEWKWSPAHGDYYCYLYNTETRNYDILKWGRNESQVPRYEPPRALAQAPRATSTTPSSHHASTSYATNVPTPAYTAPQSTGYHTDTSATAVGSRSSSYTPTYSTSSGSRTHDSGYSTLAPSTAYAPHGSNAGYNSQITTEVVRSPGRYFKKGRMFMAIPPGGNRIRNFVVIRPGTNQCDCLAFDSYDGLGTFKRGVDPTKHAPLLLNGRDVTYHPNEAPLRREALYVIVENDDVTFDPMSRLDLSRTYTISHGTSVCTIGRIDPGSLHHLDEADEY